MTEPFVSECEAGHESHATRDVTLIDGRTYRVFNADQYNDVIGFCEGDCDVCRTIIRTGWWSPDGTALIQEILAGGDPETEHVFDYGAESGFYSSLAVLAGYRTVGIEASSENAKLARHNAPGAVIEHRWVDDHLIPLPWCPVRLLKVDLEGNDRHAVHECGHLFQQGLVRFALIEMSPVFNGTYPALVEYLYSLNYQAADTHGVHTLADCVWMTEADALAFLDTVDQTDYLWKPA